MFLGAVGRKRHHQKKARLGERKRKIFYVKTAAIFLTILVLIMTFSFILRLEQVNIQNVVITGNQAILASSLETIVRNNLEGTYMYVVPRSNALFYPQKNIEQEALAISPRIEQIGIFLDGLQTLQLTVKERETFALWCGGTATSSVSQSGNCYYLDEYGFIFAEAPDFSGNIFFKYFGELGKDPIGSQYMMREEFRGLNLFFESFQGLTVEPVSLTKLEDQDFEIGLRDGSRIIFSTKENLATLLDNLESVFGSEALLPRDDGQVLDYVDLRFGNKVFYKFTE